MKFLPLALGALTAAVSVSAADEVVATDAITVGKFNSEILVNTFDNIFVDFNPAVDTTASFDRAGEVSIVLPTAKKGRWGTPDCVLIERPNDLSLANSHVVNALIIEHADGYNFISAPFDLKTAPTVDTMRLICTIKTPLESLRSTDETDSKKIDPYKAIIYAGIFFSNGVRGTQLREEASTLDVVDYNKLFNNVSVRASGDNYNFGDGLRVKLTKAQMDVSRPITLSDNLNMLHYFAKNDVLDTKCNGVIDGENVKVDAVLNVPAPVSKGMQITALENAATSVTFTFEKAIPLGKNAEIECPDITAAKTIRGVPLVVRTTVEVPKEVVAEEEPSSTFYLNNAIIDMDNAAPTFALMGAGAVAVASLLAFVF